MLSRNHSRLALVLCLSCSLLAPVVARAQNDDTTAPEKHGRKYKAPPETSHIEVTVLKGFDKKPIMNAAVIFHPIKDGVDSGTLEVKTDPDGKAVIDVIPTGSQVRIQVLADGFATYAKDYLINEPSRQIEADLARPQAQISAYTDNEGKLSRLQPGIQEPIRPKKAAPATTPSAGASSSKPPAASSTSTTPASKPQQ